MTVAQMFFSRSPPKIKDLRPLIAKFEHYKHKELVKKQGKEVKGTHLGVNNQFLQEILEMQKDFPFKETENEICHFS